MSIISRLPPVASEFVQRAANSLGLELRRYPASSISWRFADRARRAGLRAYDVVVLDVGANEGQFANEVHAHGFKGKIVSFEPLAAPFAVLSQRCAGNERWTCHRFALGSESGQATLHVASNHGASSSIFKPLEAHNLAAPHVAFTNTETVSLARLDDFALAEQHPESSFAIKADVQGYELQVLKGAQQLLNTGRVSFIQLEMSIRPVYQSAPSALELISFMEDIGFGLVDLGGEFRDRMTRDLVQVDAVFASRDNIV